MSAKRPKKIVLILMGNTVKFEDFFEILSLMCSASDSYYSDSYEWVTNTGAVGLVSKATHYSMENFPYTLKMPRRAGINILELGAGHGQHLKYVRDDFERYQMTDIRPALLANFRSANPKVNVESEAIDAENLPYLTNEFDRLIATCLLIHLKDPEKALCEWQRVCKPGGLITIYVPCESGVLLRFMQAFTTRRKQRRIGLNATYLHYQEHPYSYPYILSLISEVFGKGSVVRKFPFVFGSFDFNLWAVVTIRNNK